MSKSDIDRATREAAAKRREAKAPTPPTEPFDFLDDLPSGEAIDTKAVGELARQAKAGRLVAPTIGVAAKHQLDEADARVARKRAKAGGRPKLPQEDKVPAPVGFLLRCSPEEKLAWMTAALEEGPTELSLTAWIRRVCNEAVKGGR